MPVGKKNPSGPSAAGKPQTGNTGRTSDSDKSKQTNDSKSGSNLGGNNNKSGTAEHTKQPSRKYTLPSGYAAKDISKADELSDNVNWKPYTGIPRKCHPCADSARALATLKVLTLAGKQSDVVVDLFGHWRTESICNTNNISGASFKSKKPNSPKRLIVTIPKEEDYCASDQSRRGSVPEPSKHGTHLKDSTLMMVDVYQLTPKQFVSRMRTYHSKVGYVVRQMFCGEAGVNFNGECPWRYDEGELRQVVGKECEKAPHPRRNDQLWSETTIVEDVGDDSTQEYTITQVCTVSDYEILEVAPAQGLLLTTIASLMTRRNTRTPMVSRASYTNIRGEKVSALILNDAINLAGLYKFKNNTGWNKATMKTYIYDSFRKNKVGQLERVFETSEMEQLISNSINYIVADAEHIRTRAYYLIDEVVETLSIKAVALIDVLREFFDFDLGLGDTPAPVFFKDLFSNLGKYIRRYLMILWDFGMDVTTRLVSFFRNDDNRLLSAHLTARTKNFRSINAIQLDSRYFATTTFRVIEPLHVSPSPQLEGVNKSVVSDEDLGNYLAAINEKYGKDQDIKEGIYHYASFVSPLQPAGCLVKALNKVYPATPIVNCIVRQKGYNFSDELMCASDKNVNKCKYHNKWMKVAEVFKAYMGESKLSDSDHWVEYTSEEWVKDADTAAKRKKYEDVRKQLEEDLSDPKFRGTAMLKSDEAQILMVEKEEGDGTKYKGRIIANIHPESSYQFAQVKTAYKALADIVSTRHLRVGDISIRAILCSAKSSEELSNLRNELVSSMVPNSILLLDSGDDLLVYFKTAEGELKAWEGDFKSFDGSQGAHAHYFFFNVCKMIGIPEISITFFKDFVANTSLLIKVKDNDDTSRNVKSVLPRAWIMKSGQGTTTLQNGIDSLGALIYILSRWANTIGEITLENWQSFHDTALTEAQTLGYTLIGENHEQPNNASFLKGWFVPTTNGNHIFLPLLSRRLKMGNLRTNPMSFTRSHDLDHAVRIAQYMESQAGLGIPRNYPVIGKYLGDCAKRGISTVRDYKPTFGRIDYSSPTEALVDREQLDLMLLSRYKATSDDLDELHETPDKPYVIVGSPLAKILYEADYAVYPTSGKQHEYTPKRVAGEAFLEGANEPTIEDVSEESSSDDLDISQ